MTAGCCRISNRPGGKQANFFKHKLVSYTVIMNSVEFCAFTPKSLL